MKCKICGRAETDEAGYCQYCADIYFDEEDAYGGEYIADLCEECGISTD